MEEGKRRRPVYWADISSSLDRVKRRADVLISKARNGETYRQLRKELDGWESQLLERGGGNAVEHSNNPAAPELGTRSRGDGTSPALRLPGRLRAPRLRRDWEVDAMGNLAHIDLTSQPGTQRQPFARHNLPQSARKTVVQLLSGPRETLHSCAQTLENCQDNLQSLGVLLQGHASQNLARLPTPKMPKLQVRFTTRSSAVAPVDAAEVPSQQERLPTLEDLLSPFLALSQKLRAKEIEDLQRIIRGAFDEIDSLKGQKMEDGRRMGPLQLQAMRRRRERDVRTHGSSLRTPGRKVAIYTTASLPWMTGTAVNPLLRAAYLSKDAQRKVTLVIPWLAVPDQKMVFPRGITFETPEEQEHYVREWARKRTGLPCNFKVAFYPSRYAAEKCSILPVGDPTSYIPDSEADVAVLEEPEHLNWYHHGRRWTDKFKHVVGVIHTNYLDYAQREADGEIKAQALALMNQLVCRMHCHKVVKLSDAVQPLPRQTTEFVHGVPKSFIDVGEKKAHQPDEGQPRFTQGAYFIGKAIWAKGYTELLDLMDRHTRRGGPQLHIDCYGSGEDLKQMEEFARKRGLDMQFHGGRDHLDPSMHEYKVFVNPSTSDVVATTTAEALAMGKWVVVKDLPCNAFFSSFSNCLTYRTPEEFSARLARALAEEPKPMGEEERERLTWEAATERFLNVSELHGDERNPPISSALDTFAFNLHNYLTGVEYLRAASGAGVNTRDNPISIQAFVPSEDRGGGFFDNKARHAAAQAVRLKG